MAGYPPCRRLRSTGSQTLRFGFVIRRVGGLEVAADADEAAVVVIRRVGGLEV